MENNIPKKLVKCPRCSVDTVYAAENPFRPFCSKRCRLIDLGEWVEGNFKIAGEIADPASILANFEISEDEIPQ